jgi:hypothetical protein
MGLEQYGRNSIARVKEHFLPNKSARQLSNRYRHLSSSITWNPIKELKARWKWADQANLSEYEKEIVRNGIASFGYDWERISHLLPHRYPARFQQLWNTICPADVRALLSASSSSCARSLLLTLASCFSGIC